MMMKMIGNRAGMDIFHEYNGATFLHPINVHFSIYINYMNHDVHQQQ